MHLFITSGVCYTLGFIMLYEVKLSCPSTFGGQTDYKQLRRTPRPPHPRAKRSLRPRRPCGGSSRRSTEGLTQNRNQTPPGTSSRERSWRRGSSVPRSRLRVWWA